MKIPVLTYHSTNIFGNTYQTNDLIAFKEDLTLIKELAVEIISAHDLVKWLQGLLNLDESKSYVVLTFDDGCELDFYDWQHPTHGQQYSFYSSIQSFGGSIHVTSFVIASKQARSILVQTCTAGHEIWGDDWWQQAEKSGQFSIENHSWDHLHTTLSEVKQQNNEKGDFTKILNLADATAQFKDASDYIDSRIQHKQTQLFAYPFGHYNDYLSDDYLPKQQDGIIAAFTCEAESVLKETNIWKIPRYVCGQNWKTSEQLKQILIK